MPNPSPVLIADKCTLTFSAEAEGRIRIVYQGWDDPRVVLPGQHIEIRRGPQGGRDAGAGGRAGGWLVHSRTNTSVARRSTTSTRSWCRATVPTEPKLLIPVHTGFTKEAVRIMSVAERLRSIADRMQAGRRIKHNDMMRWCRITAEYLEDTVREMPPAVKPAARRPRP
jgi:hypothetical protein